MYINLKKSSSSTESNHQLEFDPKYQTLLREHEVLKKELELEEEMTSDLLDENMKLKKTIRQIVSIGIKSGDLCENMRLRKSIRQIVSIGIKSEDL